MISKIQSLLGAQKKYFSSGATLTRASRIETLKKLKAAIKKYENEILAALYKDLVKPEFEAYSGEVGFVYEEINYLIKNLGNWLKPRSVAIPFVQWPAKGLIHFQPVGTVLIISPWNYPFQLLLSPLAGALAAGNCAILKPSEIAPATSAIVAKILRSEFQEEQVAVFEGGADITTALLKERYGHIFFTGSTKVGKIVSLAAAATLSPCTLELGGKSPCIVDETSPLETVARRLVFGKFFNAGQTCIAPDYVLVKAEIHDAFLIALKNVLKENFGADAQKSPDYARIVNRNHFERLKNLIPENTVFHGGHNDEASLYIEPTVLTDVTLSSKVMAEEIFGPILPILKYQNFEDLYQIIDSQPNPLALYVFSKNKQFVDAIVTKISFGGGCVNDTLVHYTIPELPFGGIHESGAGAYHGRNSFELFSHKKSILYRGLIPDLKVRYRPYAKHLALLKKLMR